MTTDMTADMTLKTQPPPLRLGLSMVGSGSPAAQRALLRHAAQIGFDVVHLIEVPRSGGAGCGVPVGRHETKIEAIRDGRRHTR